MNRTKKILSSILCVILTVSTCFSLFIGTSAVDKAVVLEYDADAAVLNVYFDNCDGLYENGLAAFMFYVTFPAEKLTFKKISKGADLKATSDTPSEATYDANYMTKYKDIAADFPALKGFADDDIVPGVITFGGYFKETLDASYYEDADNEVNAKHFHLCTIIFEGAVDDITTADFSIIIKNDKAGKAASGSQGAFGLVAGLNEPEAPTSEIPATEEPTNEESTTEEPTTAPVTEELTTIPTTAEPTTVPPTAVPTTWAPTTVPTTAVPTTVPTTATTTKPVPTTAVKPTEAPTTKAPYSDYEAATVYVGDVDGDGTIDSGDARLCLRRAIDLETYKEGSKKWLACDADFDNSISVADARLILRAALELDKSAKFSPKHKHSFEERSVARTCLTDAGKIAQCKCGYKFYIEITQKAQGHKFAKATCTQPKTCQICGVKEGKPLGHDFRKAQGTEPTCTKAGQEKMVCSRCGKEKTKEIKALGHDFKKATGKAATCTEQGEEKSICSRCGKVETKPTKALGHDYSEASCVEPKYCKRCGEKDGVPSGHNVKGWSTTKNPTNSDFGIKTGKCTKCGKTVSKVFNDRYFGEVKGLVTYQYNKYIGTRGDNGATIFLIPKNTALRESTNGRIFLQGTSGLHDSGVVVTHADGYGNFSFGNTVPAGEYVCYIVSKNTTSGAAFSINNNRDNYNAQITKDVALYLNKYDLYSLAMFGIGLNKYSSTDVSVRSGVAINLSIDFGYTYI